ncbi:conserved hypothetical protein [Vibrio chagasii]|jgi:hypothetical protein|uniref:hypothetical protein n=1 Tax=Vibrio TaxID=662 RepID=UPI0014938FF6|nr:MULTISPECIES: hypothetical protein [Vibrio]MCG9673778.1 hypothetical protein [Vibrio chagasii]NOI38369.1 hypothetical protein [Vibrio sp. 070316B]CAH6837306.1 conserved hypothetical protein [Vibrio chagasii]CAH6864422.1 conserved hypothetical protein [Vibrio chagasii]CAH6934944.1 conserved hypothetical protein [Vibrio chagasii]
MQKTMAFNCLSNTEWTAEIRAKLLSVAKHMEEFGSVSELELCKIFGETIWNDGVDYHSHAFSFRINAQTGDCSISHFKYH